MPMYVSRHVDDVITSATVIATVSRRVPLPRFLLSFSSPAVSRSAGIELGIVVCTRQRSSRHRARLSVQDPFKYNMNSYVNQAMNHQLRPSCRTLSL